MAQTDRTPITAVLEQLHDDHAANTAGEVASYIPQLAHADPNWFGICLVTVDGAVYEVGDTRQEFSIQSISKPFTYGYALDQAGETTVRQHVGVEPTGEAFNSIRLDADSGLPLNPMVNAGAIATAGLVANRCNSPSADLLAAFSKYAGRDLRIDETLYHSEMKTGHRNRAIAHLLRYSEAIVGDPEAAMDLYVRACATSVHARDLAVMGATLAEGGINPLTGERATDEATARRVLSVMSTCGMYDGAGRWLYEVGLPAKSGVAGGIVAVLPGRFAVSVFSPPLDERGNSVRGIEVCRQLSSDMDLHVVRPGDHDPSPIRLVTSVALVRSRRQRSNTEVDALKAHGHEVAVIELQGDLDFAATERVTRALVSSDARYTVVDFRRVDYITTHAAVLLTAALTDSGGADGHTVIGGAGQHPVLQASLRAFPEHVVHFDDPDRAREWAEDQLLTDLGAHVASDGPLALHDFDVVAPLTDEQRARLASLLVSQSFDAGRVVLRRDEPTALLFVLSGRLSLMLERTSAAPERVVTVSAGGTIGELSLLGTDPRVTDVRADTDVQLLSLPATTVDELRTSDPDLRAGLLEGLLSLVGRRADDIRRQVAALGR